MEEQLQRIQQAPGVHGIAVWGDAPGTFLGCLLDDRFQQIPGSTPWNASDSIQDVLDSLERAAQTLTRRADTTD